MKSGEPRSAAQWLDWARELVRLEGGDDPLRVSPFARLWVEGKGEPQLAAAALCAEGPQANQGLPVLEAARDKASEPQRTLLEHALAIGYEASERTGDALAAATRLEAAAPTSGVARALRYAALAKLGRHDTIVTLVKQRLESKPDDVRLLGTLAWAEDALGYAGRLPDGREAAGVGEGGVGGL